MNYLKTAIASSLLVAAALTGACTPKTVNTVRVSDDGSSNWIKTDPRLADYAQVQRVSKTRLDDHLRISVEVLNTSKKQRQIQYQVVWLDQDNMPIPTPMTTWKRLIIEGQQSATLSAIAPDSRATDARLEMIRAD